MTLTVTTEPREQRQLAVTIEAPQERVDRELRKAATKLSSQYRLSGFRPGKAPYNVVVQHFGMANLYNEFVDELGQELFLQAVEQEKIEPYAMATLEDVQFDPLRYQLIVPLEPMVTLGDYRAVRVEEPPAVADEEVVEQRLEQMREQYAKWQPVERASEYGDLMTIDVKSVIQGEGDGGETVVLDETDWDVTPDEENPMDPPGFDAALIGLKKGESKEFVLGWPADSQSIHAGKEATFKVTVKEIEAYEKPPLDDALAPMINPDFATLDDVRKNLRESVARSDEARRSQEYLNQVLDAVVDISTLDYPPVVVEDQLDSMMREYENRLRMFGIDDLDRYFEQTGQDRNEFREGLREQATKQAQRNLVLSEVVRVEQLTVSDDEIHARIDTMTQAIPEGDPTGEGAAMANLLKSQAGHGIIANEVLRDKAIERMLAIARGEEVPAPGEEPPAAEAGAESAAASESAASESAEADPA